MAIQNRRGNYADFDPQKLVPGEWAVVQSGDPNSERGRAVYMAFNVGEIERMATYEDMQENIVSATTDVQEQFASELTQTISDANSAVTTMRNDIDDEIASASETINNLTARTNAVMDSARLATTQANDAAESAYDAADAVQSIIDSGTTVMSWNNRAGLVTPESGDYTSAQITHNNTTVEDALNFDSAPTVNSTRAVQSGGVFSILGNTALGTVATTITGAIKELKTAISGLQDILNNQMFKMVVKTWDNVTIGADWYWQSNPSIALTGYRPVAIVGYTVYRASSSGANSNWCIFQRCYITPADRLDMYVWNQNKNASAKVQIAVRVLYVKTGLIV